MKFYRYDKSLKLEMNTDNKRRFRNRRKANHRKGLAGW